MKVENAETASKGQLLSSFGLGDCVRLVGPENGFGHPFIGHVYIVSSFNGHSVAVNLFDGCHRESGGFVLEPNAKVVIE
jgi:hypothetical protein